MGEGPSTGGATTAELVRQVQFLQAELLRLQRVVANAPPQVPARMATGSPKRPAEEQTAEVEAGAKRPAKVRGTAGAGVRADPGRIVTPPVSEEGWQVVPRKSKGERARAAAEVVCSRGHWE